MNIVSILLPLLAALVALITWTLLDIKELKQLMSTQESQLQEVQTILNTVATGVTEIITRLNALPTADNPAIQDEIDGIRNLARSMGTEIDAVLNPPAPEDGGEEPPA